MATSILNPPPVDRPVLTSALYSMQASTDKLKVSVEIVRDPDGYDDCFFSTTMYPYRGIVEISDIGSLIAERLRAVGRSWDMMEIRVDEATAEFTAVYCDYDLDDDFDFSNCFLTAAGISIVHPNSAVSLTHWNNGTNQYVIKIVGLDSDGNTAAVNRLITCSPTATNLTFAVNYIIATATDGSGDTGGSLASVAYFVVSYASMRKIFYIVRHPFFLTFGFRNMFNAYEFLDLVGIVRRQTKYDRTSVISYGKIKQYNQTVEQTFEVQTAALTDDQLRAVEQLVGSRAVQLCAASCDYDIIITDHTLEADNDNESLSSVKFTFRFVGEHPVILRDDMGALMPSRTHIFSQQFTTEFA